MDEIRQNNLKISSAQLVKLIIHDFSLSEEEVDGSNTVMEMQESSSVASQDDSKNLWTVNLNVSFNPASGKGYAGSYTAGGVFYIEEGIDSESIDSFLKNRAAQEVFDRMNTYISMLTMDGTFGEFHLPSVSWMPPKIS